MKSNRLLCGQGLVELILAMAIFTLTMPVLISLLLGSFRGLMQGGEHVEADALAQEGMEAVRAIRDRAWNELRYTQSGVSVVSNEWRFSGQGTQDTLGKYQRSLQFSPVCRDASHNLVTCPGSYTDVHSKLVIGTVTWDVRPGVQNTVTREIMMSNWDSQNWLEDTTANFGDGTYTNTVNSTALGDGNGAVVLSQTPGVEILKPQSFVDPPGSWINETNAYDGATGGDTLTAATTNNPTGANPSVRYFNWTPAVNAHTARRLIVRRQSSGCANDRWTLAYSTNGGGSWSNIQANMCNVAVGNTTAVTISNSLNLANLQVRVVYTRNGTQDPMVISLWDIWLEGDYTGGYALSGEYVSSAFNTGKVSAFNVVSWVGSKTNANCGACVIQVQVQTAPNAGGSPGTWSSTWSGFEGEDGDATDYYTVSAGELIHTDHNGDQWVRYKAVLTGDGSNSPILEDITINHQ